MAVSHEMPVGKCKKPPTAGFHTANYLLLIEIHDSKGHVTQNLLGSTKQLIV